MNENLHKGHRERMKEEFLSMPESAKTADYKLLEMLLFYGIPQKDTNPIAHALIKTFGSFHAVLEADVTELTKVKGMTKNAACLIKLMLPLAKAYITEKYDGGTLLSSYDDISFYILSNFFGICKEQCSILCMNHAGKVLYYDVISEGDIDSVGISIRTIMEKIIQTGATAIVLAHNHPSGFALPSKNDVTITAAISKALKTVNVRLVDHIIIANDDYISMAQSGEYKELFD